MTAGGSIQAAIDSAVAGDVITIQAGANFDVSTITLPFKTGDDWIYITTDQVDSLPGQGTRVSLADTVYMPRIYRGSGGNTAVFASNYRANKYRFVGLYISTDVATLHLMIFGHNAGYSGEATVQDSLPTDIIIDRCVLGPPSANDQVRHGITPNIIRGAVKDSYIWNIVSTAESQTIRPYNTPGPLMIVNNYLEASGENFMCGGDDPGISGLVPSDLWIENNYFFKPLAWDSSDPSWDGSNWEIKNLLELKNAKEVMIRGNVFQNMWAAAQVGHGIVLTVRNQEGTAPQSTVKDLMVEDNIIIDSIRGFNILVADNLQQSALMDRIWIRNNIYKPGAKNRANGMSRIGLSSVASQFTYDPGPGLTFLNNTFIYTTEATNFAFELEGQTPNNKFVVWRNNVIATGNLGIWGTGLVQGTQTMNTHWQHYVFYDNVMFGRPGLTNFYPPGNFMLSTNADVGFVDYAGGDYTITGTHSDKGADISALATIESCVVAGTPCP